MVLVFGVSVGAGLDRFTVTHIDLVEAEQEPFSRFRFRVRLYTQHCTPFSSRLKHRNKGVMMDS